jgi:hypothetical protein
LADDDDARRTLKKLKTASRALKSAQRASRDTMREVDRAKRAVAKVQKEMRPFEHPRIRSRRRR